jgi:chromate transporter
MSNNPNAEIQTRNYPTYGEAFRFWLRLGFISFGGPAGQIAIMHEFLVEKKKWISDSRFLHALNYCMLLPGPEAQQLATYMGWLLHGVRGGLTAGILFILPSVFILLGLSIAYVMFGKLEWVAALFYGLKPAVIAIVILALIKIGKKSLHSAIHYAIALASFIAIFFFNVAFPWIVLFAVALGLFVQRYHPGYLNASANSARASSNEHDYLVNRDTPPVSAGLNLKSALLKMFTGVLLWTLPFLAFILFNDEFQFWSSIISFFTKAAFVTFGGAYAVLPYVAQITVEKLSWLTEYQMIDGLALGETTPGPLIMVLVFVGFMAGYNHFSGSVLAGSIGLVTTAYYTFLPSFLFILIGAPFVEHTKENTRVRDILSIITAAVVGVILNLTIYFATAVIFSKGIRQPDWFALAWVLVSVVAMLRFKVNMILWIGISALAGLLYSLIANVG